MRTQRSVDVSAVVRALILGLGVVTTLGSAVACDESPTSATATTSGDTASSGGSPGTGTSLTVTATRFLAFGDSLTSGEVTAPATSGLVAGPLVVVPTASFPSQLQDRLRARYLRQASDIVVTNAGRSGELVGSALPRLSEILANAQVQAVLLLHGYEDLLLFGAGGVNPALAGYDRLAQEARRRSARVFIALLPPPIAGRQRSVPDGVVRDFNGGLRAIAAGEGAAVVDLYTALGSDLSRYIGVDGHHPNEQGYRRIAEEFVSRIAAELERR